MKTQHSTFRCVAVFACSGLLACSSSTSSAPPTDADGLGAIGRLAATPGVGPRFASSSLDVTANGLRAAAGTSAGTLEATLPLDAAKPLRFEVTSHPEQWLELTESKIAPSAVHVIGGAAVYPDVYPSTDRVLTAGVGWSEEFHVLRDAGAPQGLDYVVRTGSGIASVRVREGRVEALDSAGVVKIATSRTVLIDANGTRRDSEVTYEPNGAGGMLHVKWSDAGLRYPIVVDPSWSAVAPMANGRRKAASLLLPSGKVLVTAGGSTQSEVYDPATNTWTTVAGTSFAKSTALTLLASGSVLAAECQYAPYPVNQYVIRVKSLDPTSSAGWVDLPDGPNGCDTGYYLDYGEATGAVTLSSGKVLIVGTTSYLFDPATNATVWAGDMPATAYEVQGKPQAVSTGRVVSIVQGGVVAWTPGTDGWAFVSTSGLQAAKSMLLPSGEVLFAGDLYTQSTLIYKTATNTVVAGPTMVRQHSGHSLSLLPTNRVLIAGTLGLPVAEELDPVTNISRWVSSMLNIRDYHTAVALPSGKILVAGGDPFNKTTELYQTALGQTCTLDDDCADPLFYCNAGHCASQKAYGEACGRFRECLSNACTDGVCCDSACSGSCQACNVPGSIGTCSTVPAGDAPHGTRAACSGSGTCGAVCDGSDVVACHYPTTTKACGADSCTAGVERRWSFCDGSGSCNDAPRSCAPYACGTTSCRTDCTVDAHCAPGFRCTAGACTP